MRRSFTGLLCVVALLGAAGGGWAGAAVEGPEFMVNESTASGSKYSRARTSVARSYDGSFVVVWSGYTFDPLARDEIVVRRFASDGTALGTEFVVNTYATGSQRLPAVGLAPDGSFVVVWSTMLPGEIYGGIGARRFASDGRYLRCHGRRERLSHGRADHPARRGRPERLVDVSAMHLMKFARARRQRQTTGHLRRGADAMVRARYAAPS